MILLMTVIAIDKEIIAFPKGNSKKLSYFCCFKKEVLPVSSKDYLDFTGNQVKA